MGRQAFRLEAALGMTLILSLFYEARRVRWKQFRDGFVWLLVAFALVLRIFLSGEFVGPDEFHHILTIDRVSRGDFLFHWPTGFYLLAVPLAWLVRDPKLAASWTNLALSSLSVYLAYLLAKGKWGRWAGYSAALLFAMLPVHIFFAGSALLETSSLFFMLLSLVLFQKGDGAMPLALSYFCTIRFENYLLALPVFLAWLMRRRQLDWRSAFFLVALLVSFRVHLVRMDAPNWAPSLRDPQSTFLKNLPINVRYFFDRNYFNPLIAVMALFAVPDSWRDPVLLVLVASFLFYTTYNLGVFTRRVGPSRYAFVPSAMATLLASSLVSSREEFFWLSLAVALLFVPGTLMSETHIGWMVNRLSDNPGLGAANLTVVADFPEMVQAARPDRVVVGEREGRGEFFLVTQTVLTPFPDFSEMLGRCEVLQSWNYSREFTGELFIRRIRC